jgi:hypothetical protein
MGMMMALKQTIVNQGVGERAFNSDLRNAR